MHGGCDMSARITSGDARTAAAGRRLAELLVVRPAYRARWQRLARQQDTLRSGFATAQQAAVARVLAEHLRGTGQAPTADRALHRRLKDRVHRALAGRVMSRATLDLFLAAFGIDGPDADELTGLLERGTGGQQAVRPALAGPEPSTTYRTVALSESLTLGPDGRGRRLRTIHVVRAVRTLPGYRYLLEPGAVGLSVLRAGRAGTSTRVGPVPAVEIMFHRPLEPGRTVSVEAVARFATEGPRPGHFRRGTADRLENVELQVRFHPGLLPERVWWTVWSVAPTIRLIRSEPAPIDPDGTVHRFLDAVEAQLVGFRWRFPP
jgi:hypothetical protein